MASNVRQPENLPILGGHVRESVTVPSDRNILPFLAYTRAGLFPATDGAYAAGVSTFTKPANQDEVMALTTIGYAVIRVKPGVTIAVDGAVSASSAGEAIPTPGTGTPYVLGRALDSSDGTGTAQNPHYIVIKLGN